MSSEDIYALLGLMLSGDQAAKDKYSCLLADGTAEQLCELYEAVLRSLYGNMVFCLQLNGECISSSDFRASEFYSNCRSEIREALTDRFGLGLPESLLSLEAELEAQYGYLREFEEELWRHRGTPFPAVVESYLARCPEGRETIMAHLDEAHWEQDSDNVSTPSTPSTLDEDEDEDDAEFLKYLGAE